nr:MAG TPA: hypothetical protein [Caudoviricetes sp.]DAW68570.1 MAG TPA: hypothetical protein [Caudoviricetes sp.]
MLFTYFIRRACFLDKTFYGFNRITGWLYKVMI